MGKVRYSMILLAGVLAPVVATAEELAALSLEQRVELLEDQAMQAKVKQSGIAGLFEDVLVGAVLTTVAQGSDGLPEDTEGDHGQLGYRADVGVEVPLDSRGDISQKLYVQVWAGQGDGLNGAFGNAGILAATPNASAFRVSGATADDSVLFLAQAWYQAYLPLPLGGYLPHSKHGIEITFGKMDLYGHFDQNEVANDETAQFMNSVFVNNPLLDAGGEAATDANGFQPGLVSSFISEANAAEPWRFTLGIFGAGANGSNYQESLKAPLVLAQLEKQWKILGGLAGNYRIYGWTRDRAENFDATIEQHNGVGISVDQRLGDGVRLFARYGQMTKGSLPFDRTVTLGGDLSGNYWGREGDAIGFAVGVLQTDRDYRKTAAGVDPDQDGVVDFTFLPSGAEQVAEIYYRYRITGQIELTPDLQWVGRAGGNKDADDVTVATLRINFAY